MVHQTDVKPIYIHNICNVTQESEQYPPDTCRAVPQIQLSNQRVNEIVENKGTATDANER